MVINGWHGFQKKPVPELQYQGLEVWHGMTDFRVKFKLAGKAAKTFGNVKDKPEFVAKAVEWYANFGADMMKKMDKIEAALANGVIPIQDDIKTESNLDLDKCFDKFVI